MSAPPPPRFRPRPPRLQEKGEAMAKFRADRAALAAAPRGSDGGVEGDDWCRLVCVDAVLDVTFSCSVLLLNLAAWFVCLAWLLSLAGGLSCWLGLTDMVNCLVKLALDRSNYLA